MKILPLNLCLLSVPIAVVVTATAEQDREDVALQSFYTNQDRLYNNLFAKYNVRLSSIFPYDVTNKKFEVVIWLEFVKLIFVSEPQESVAWVFEFTREWTDPRLKWNPEEYGGLEQIYVNRADIWIAEAPLVDVTSFSDMRPDFSQNCLVQHNGTVTFYVTSVISTICNLNVTDFPFDKQKCGIHFAKPAINFMKSYDFVLKIKMDLSDLSYSGNGEWKMVQIIPSAEVFPDGPILYSYDVYMERYSTFYVTLIVFPLFILNIISVIGVFLKDGDSVSKLMIGLTNILSLTFIFGTISDNLPTSKNLPLLGYYVLINLSIMVLAVLAVIWLPQLKFYTTKVTKLGEQRNNGFLKSMSSHFSLSPLLLIIMQAANLANLLYFVL